MMVTWRIAIFLFLSHDTLFCCLCIIIIIIINKYVYGHDQDKILVFGVIYKEGDLSFANIIIIKLKKSKLN